MGEREKAIQLLNVVPDYKMGYAVAYLHGMTDGEEVLNAETLEAFAEIENGGGEVFNTPDELWKSLEE